MKHTFGKNEKLTEKKMIDKIFQSERSVFKYPFKIMVLGEKNENPPKILVSVSKRNFKHAVDRNLIKRRIREGYRLNKYTLQITEHKTMEQKTTENTGEKLFFACESLAIIYIAKEILPSQEIHKKLFFLLKEITKII